MAERALVITEEISERTDLLRLHNAARRTRKIAGVDMHRGILALAVFLFHGAMPPLMQGYDESSAVLRKINAVFNWSLNGQFAVLAFFLISGFCIHYPYERRILHPAGFYTARVLRLGMPAIAAIILTWIIGMRRPFQLDGVPIWSLWCELTYYLIYPALLPLIRRSRWRLLIVGSYLLALVVLLLSPAIAFYHDYGYLRCTIMGLPVWLLGALLAQQVARGLTVSSSISRVWAVRAFMLIVSAGTLTAAYSGKIGLGWSLTIASPLLYIWLREEIAYYETNVPPIALERAGNGCYSLYLIHLLCLFLLSKLPLERLGNNVAWGIKIISTLGASYLFFAVVEHPCHRLSRWVGERLSCRKTFA